VYKELSFRKSERLGRLLFPGHKLPDMCRMGSYLHSPPDIAFSLTLAAAAAAAAAAMDMEYTMGKADAAGHRIQGQAIGRLR
jgi:hypothetical protein